MGLVSGELFYVCMRIMYKEVNMLIYKIQNFSLKRYKHKQNQEEKSLEYYI